MGFKGRFLMSGSGHCEGRAKVLAKALDWANARTKTILKKAETSLRLATRDVALHAETTVAAAVVRMTACERARQDHVIESGSGQCCDALAHIQIVNGYCGFATRRRRGQGE